MNNNYGDKKSKRAFLVQLFEKGFKVWDADIPENEYVFRPDIFAEKNGQQYAFELKARTCPSTQYGDILISEHKVHICDSHPELKYYLVFFYTDGVGYILDPSAEHTVKWFNTPKTTHFGDHSYSKEPKAVYQTTVAQHFDFTPELIYN